MIKLNKNPKGIKTGDCVVRAICYATQQSWDDVYKDLCDLGLKMKRMPNEKQVYEKYLERLGWSKQKQPRKANGFKYTVDEFAKELTFEEANYRCGEIEKSVGDIVVIKVAGHLTCINKNQYEDFEVVDTWDCGYKTVGNYWIKEEK